MSVAKFIELSGQSAQGYEDAIRQAVERASRTIRNITSVWEGVRGRGGEQPSDPVPGGREDRLHAGRGSWRRLSGVASRNPVRAE